MVEDARAMVAETGERSYEAELHRLRGDLLHEKAKRTGRKSGLETQAEEALRTATGIARSQGHGLSSRVPYWRCAACEGCGGAPRRPAGCSARRTPGLRRDWTPPT